MFEELKKRLGKREAIEDEMEFKSFEEVKAEPVAEPQHEAPVSHESTTSDSVELKVVRPEEYAEVAVVQTIFLQAAPWFSISRRWTAPQ